MNKLYIRVLSLAIILFTFGSLCGQKLTAVGINGGYVVPVGNVSTGYTIELRADFGEVLKYVFLLPTISYWQVEEENDIHNLNRTYLNFGTNFIGYINSKPRGFYGGMGINYQIISAEENDSFNNLSPDIKTVTNTRLGFSVLFGYLQKFKRVSLYLEPSYSYIYGGYNILQVKLGFNYILK